MTRHQNPPSAITHPTFIELFTPKLVTILREGYSLANLRADALAGLTVAIVALPLSMAIAIASGASPAQGLYTAIIGGFFVSAFGGSRFQIGGPAGAFIVLVAATVQTQGMDGLILATLLSGLILTAIGFFRLGTYIKFIPYPVTVGFTAGIAVIIFASQVKDLLGLTLDRAEPGALLEKIPLLIDSLPTLDAATLALSLATILAIIGLKRVRARWPGLLIAVSGAAVATALFDLPVATIGTRFGGIPSSLPLPALPDITLDPIASWSDRALPTSPRACLAASASPAPSPARRQTCAPGPMGRLPACCTPFSCWPLCWSRPHWPATSRWPAWPACLPWWPGT